jgi:integrase
MELRMASIAKHGNGYRAQVYVKGVRETKKFRTKAEALAWAGVRETALRQGEAKDKHTFGELVARYCEEVAPEKRGERWEIIRLRKLENDALLPFSLPLSKISAAQITEWRDARLRQVSSGSVLREMGLLSAVFEVARRDWGWITENPVRNVRKPSSPAHRERVISRGEIRAMLRTMGYTPAAPVRSVSQSVAVCFLLALRTGMRAGELCGLTWDNVHNSYCRLPVTKTKPRDVPLTAKAIRLIERMRGWDDGLVFGLKTQTLDALFRKYRMRAGLSGFTFHDSRHTAATWIAGRMRDAGLPAQQALLDMCKMFGWTQLDRALTYYNPSAADIARRIG